MKRSWIILLISIISVFLILNLISFISAETCSDERGNYYYCDKTSYYNYDSDYYYNNYEDNYYTYRNESYCRDYHYFYTIEDYDNYRHQCNYYMNSYYYSDYYNYDYRNYVAYTDSYGNIIKEYRYGRRYYCNNGYWPWSPKRCYYVYDSQQDPYYPDYYKYQVENSASESEKLKPPVIYIL